MWLSAEEGALHVRPSGAGARAAIGAGVRCFDLWRIVGRKDLVGVADAVLTVSIGACHARLLLDARLSDGVPCVCTVPLTPHLRRQLAEFQALARLLDGLPLCPASKHSVGRSGLLHVRALQALDGVQAGASHRELAAALFGLDAVRSEWHADGVMRAQVRHLVSRAEGFMRCGYLGLAGLRPGDDGAHGDEAGH